MGPFEFRAKRPAVHLRKLPFGVNRHVKIARWCCVALMSLSILGYAEEVERFTSEKHLELITAIKTSLSTSTDPKLQVELSLRLAKLYREEFSRSLVEDVNTKSRETAKFVLLDEAIRLYEQVLRRYPRSERTDEILYGLGFSNIDRDKLERGIHYLSRLIREYPRSQHHDDSVIQVSNHHFDRNEIRLAEAGYTKLLKKRSPLMNYARFKKAWCAYLSGRLAESIQLFKSALTEQATEHAPELRLSREILADIALPLVDMDKLEEAMTFYQSQGETAQRTGFALMATRYFAKENYLRAITLWRELLDQDDTDPKNPSYEIHLVESMIGIGQERAAAERLIDRAPRYLGKETSTWKARNSGNPEVLSQASDLFERNVREIAFRVHRDADKKKSDELYEVTRLFYTGYLDYFPNTEKSVEVRFNLADVFRQTGRVPEAVENYRLVAQNPAAGNLRPASLRLALSSLDSDIKKGRKLRDVNGNHHEPSNEQSTPPAIRSYSDAEQMFLDLAEDYLKEAIAGEDRREILYERAYLRYTHLEFPKAYVDFMAVVESASDQELAYSAAQLALECLNRTGDYPELINACGRLLRKKMLTSVGFRSEVANIRRQSLLKVAQSAEQAQKPAEAAALYMNFVRDHGTEDPALNEKALYNAIVNYKRARDIPAAIVAGERLLRNLHTKSLEPQILLELAGHHELLGEFRPAASYLERFTQSFDSHSQAESALRLSILFYRAAGADDKASTLLELYLQRYPDQIGAVREELNVIFARQGLKEREVALLEAALKGDRLSPRARFLHSARLLELRATSSPSIERDIEALLQYAQLHLPEIVKERSGLLALAKLLLESLELKAREFRNLSLTSTPAEDFMREKLGKLKSMGQDYARITSLGDTDWAQAASLQLATVYTEFLKEIKNTPIPKELTGEEIDSYRSQLKERVTAPLEKKVKEILEACRGFARMGQKLHAQTAHCDMLLSELDPESEPRYRSFYLPPVQIALMSDPQSSDPSTNGNQSRRHRYPFDSTALFVNAGFPRSALENKDIDDAQSIIPVPVTYERLSGERQQALQQQCSPDGPVHEEEGSADSMTRISCLRFTSPKEALKLVLSALRQNALSEPLHLLLGVIHLELGNLPAAEASWIGMRNRGIKHPAVLNNLGVAAYLAGNESQAFEWFQEAALADSAPEAFSNLGFLALKYRNSNAAKVWFEKAMTLHSDAPSTVGIALAKYLEGEDATRDFDALKELHPMDPLARLSAGYFHLDKGHDPKTAMALFMPPPGEAEASDKTSFARALRETRAFVTAGNARVP